MAKGPIESAEAAKELETTQCGLMWREREEEEEEEEELGER